MSVAYIVASLPGLRFGEKPAITWEKFCEITGVGVDVGVDRWRDLETQLKNAVAEARGGAKYARSAEGCSLYWKKRIADCFAEKDVLKRDEALDRVWWDAAEEITNVADPLGRGALATYAIRLKIALKRAKISTDQGNAAFDRLTAATNLGNR